MIFTKTSGLAGEVTIPGDKSISHRAIMLGALSSGTTEITNFLQGADCLSTIDCFRKLGISIEQKGSKILFTMNPRAKVRVEEIDGFLKQYRNKMKIKPEANLVFVFESTGIPKKDLLAKVREIIGGIQKLQDKS